MSEIPIYIYEEEGMELPDKGTYYVIAKNGTFLRKDTGIVCGLAKVDGINALAEIETYVRANLPKIPGSVVFKALTFFRRVYNQYQAESEVGLFFNKKTLEYKLTCRKQAVSGGGVDYSSKVGGREDPEELKFYSEMRKAGWTRVGTIHSHCDFGAFHSSIDTEDEKLQDGIHITIGHVNRRHFSMVASLLVYGTRYPSDVESLIDDIELRSDNGGTKYTYMTWSQPANYYDFTFTDQQTDEMLNDVLPEIVEEWMPKVSKRSYASFSGSTYNTNHNNWQGRPSAPATSLSAPYIPAEPIGGATPSVQGPALPPGILEGKDNHFLWQVRGAAHALKSQAASDIPQERQESLRAILRKFFGKDDKADITAADLELAASVEPKQGGD